MPYSSISVKKKENEERHPGCGFPALDVVINFGVNANDACNS
jgi:hypothetical protein